MRFHQHTGVRVADMDRAARFYLEAFDAEWLNRPYELSGPEIESLFPFPGLRLRVAHVGFEDGALELLQFLEPEGLAGASPAGDAPEMSPHFGLYTAEIDRVYAAVEPAGGRLLTEIVSVVAPSGREHRVFFCADPDGNAIEVLDFTMEDVVSGAHESFPESDPARGGTR
jgi:catechol 2,3-dioxygenase-like lactoylglutathione lyase family enzyme